MDAVFTERCNAAWTTIVGTQNPTGPVIATPRSVAAALETSDSVAAAQFPEDLREAIEEAVAPYVVQRTAAATAVCNILGPVLQGLVRHAEFATVAELIRWRSALEYCGPEAKAEIELALQYTDIGPRPPPDVILAYKDAAEIVRNSEIELIEEPVLTSEAVLVLFRTLLEALAEEIEHRADAE